MSNPFHLAVVIGSTRQGRFAPTVAHWFAAQARLREDLSVDVIDLAEAHLPDVLASQPPLEVAAVTPRFAAADAFVIVTPEYNHSFPAPLKTAIDWLGNHWQAKPVGFVSYGGVSGGLRAVEQLRQILAECHAVTVRNSVSFHGVWAHFGADGQLTDSARHNRTAQSMLDQIAWWARALGEARAKHPYAA